MDLVAPTVYGIGLTKADRITNSTIAGSQWFFPGHANYDENFSDPGAGYHPQWKRDVTHIFMWWILDNFCDPVYGIKAATAGQIMGYQMKPGTHSLTLQAGYTYHMDYSFKFSAQVNNAAYGAFYLRPKAPGNTTMLNNSGPAVNEGPTSNLNTMILPEFPQFVLKRLTLDLNGSTISHNTSQTERKVFADGWGSITTGSTGLTNCVLSDDWDGTVNGTNVITNVHKVDTYPGMPAVPDTAWLNQPVYRLDKAEKGTNKDTYTPIGADGGWTNSPDGLPPIVFAVDTVNKTATLKWQNGTNCNVSSGTWSFSTLRPDYNIGTYDGASPPGVTDWATTPNVDNPKSLGLSLQCYFMYPVLGDYVVSQMLGGRIASASNTTKIITTALGSKVSPFTADNVKWHLVLDEIEPRKTLSTPIISMASAGSGAEPQYSTTVQNTEQTYNTYTIEDIVIKNGTVRGLNPTGANSAGGPREGWHNFQFNGCYNIEIDNVDNLDAWGDNFFFGFRADTTPGWAYASDKITIKNSDINRAGRHNFSPMGVTRLTVDNCTWKNAAHWFIDNEILGATNPNRNLRLVWKNSPDCTWGDSAGWISGSPVVPRSTSPKVYTGCKLTPGSTIVETTSPLHSYFGGEDCGAYVTGPSQYISPGTYIIRSIRPPFSGKTGANGTVTSYPGLFELSQPHLATSVVTTSLNIGYMLCDREWEFDNLNITGGMPNARMNWAVGVGGRDYKGTWTYTSGGTTDGVDNLITLDAGYTIDVASVGRAITQLGGQGKFDINGGVCFPQNTEVAQVLNNGTVLTTPGQRGNQIKIGVVSAAGVPTFSKFFIGPPRSDHLFEVYEVTPLPRDGLKINNVRSPNSWGGNLFDYNWNPREGMFGLSRSWTNVVITNNDLVVDQTSPPGKNYVVSWKSEPGGGHYPVNSVTHVVDPANLPVNALGPGIYTVQNNKFLNAGDNQYFPVTKDSTTLSLSQSASSIIVGGTVTYTATLVDATTGNTPINGKTVTFYERQTSSNVSIGTGTTNSSGIATLAKSNWAQGIHTVFAVFNEDSTYLGSGSSDVIVTVGSPPKIDTTVTVVCDVVNTLQGEPVTISGTVTPNSGSGIPTGNLTLQSNSATIITLNLDTVGHFSYTTSFVNTGTHIIDAIYAGDIAYNGSTGSTSVEVLLPPPTPLTGGPVEISDIFGDMHL